jgi:hypothetical protein
MYPPPHSMSVTRFAVKCVRVCVCVCVCVCTIYLYIYIYIYYITNIHTYIHTYIIFIYIYVYIYTHTHLCVCVCVWCVCVCVRVEPLSIFSWSAARCLSCCRFYFSFFFFLFTCNLCPSSLGARRAACFAAGISLPLPLACLRGTEKETKKKEGKRTKGSVLHRLYLIRPSLFLRGERKIKKKSERELKGPCFTASRSILYDLLCFV